MKFEQALLTEASTRYVVKKILTSNREGLQEFSDFYNDSTDQSWVLTPTRLMQAVGHKGMLWGLYTNSNELVGTIALKHIVDENDNDIGEIGYVNINEGHRTMANVVKLFKQPIMKSKQFDAVYVTSDIKNKGMNKVLDRISNTDRFLVVKAPTGAGNRKLFVYMVNTTKNPERESIITSHFDKHIIPDL